jgi:hypothetical protein
VARLFRLHVVCLPTKSLVEAAFGDRKEDPMSKMTIRTEGETDVVVTRRFAAPPEALYRAHTEPKLIQKWLLGPEAPRIR